MVTTIAGARPDPRIREPQLAELIEICAEVVSTKQGAMVFLVGESGSGRTATLRALAERLRASPAPRPVMLAGTLAGGKYTPLVGDRRPFEQKLSFLGETLALPALLTNPQFLPIVGLIAQLLQVGAVSISLVRDSLKADSGGDTDPGLFLKRHLREVAERRPVVCLLDGLDEAEAHFLNTFFYTSSGELIRDRPLFIVATLNGPVVPVAEDANLPYAQYTAASLVRRGLARWMPFFPMTLEEIAAWLGRAQPALVNHLHRVTGGNPDWLALLWDSLWERNKVQPNPADNRWEPTPGYELATLGTVEDILAERIQTLVDTTAPDAVDTTLYLLAIAALEGPTFTAAPLAATMDWEEDELVDFLDEALVKDQDRPFGILEEADSVTVPGVERERCLWRYRFVSSLFWRTLKGYSFAADERRQRRLQLAESLESSYGSEVCRVANVLARLFFDCGDASRSNHYRTMSKSISTADNLYYEAQLLMTAPRAGWQPIDHIRAATKLIEAAAATRRVYPYWVSLSISETAYEYAVLGGQLSLQAKALCSQAWTNERLGNRVRALELFEQALPIQRQVGNRADEARTLNGMASAYKDTGNPDRALELYEQALAIQRQIGNRADEARTLNGMALVYMHTGDPDRALELFEQALSIQRQVGDRGGEAWTLYYMGRVYKDTGNPDRALELYEQALPIHRQVGDRGGEAWTLDDMGRVYMDTGDPDRALELYEQALAIHRQAGDRGGEAWTLYHMGRVYKHTGDPDRALELYEQALAIHRQVGDRGGEAWTLYDMGRVYKDIGDPDRALELYEQALAIHRQVGDRIGEARTIGRIGVLAAAAGRPNAGLELILLGTSLLAATSYTDSDGLTEKLARLSKQLDYDSTQIEALRVKVMAAYAEDQGSELLSEAFPPDAC